MATSGLNLRSSHVRGEATNMQRVATASQSDNDHPLYSTARSLLHVQTGVTTGDVPSPGPTVLLLPPP